MGHPRVDHGLSAEHPQVKGHPLLLATQLRNTTGAQRPRQTAVPLMCYSQQFVPCRPAFTPLNQRGPLSPARPTDTGLLTTRTVALVMGRHGSTGSGHVLYGCLCLPGKALD